MMGGTRETAQPHRFWVNVWPHAIGGGTYSSKEVARNHGANADLSVEIEITVPAAGQPPGVRLAAYVPWKGSGERNGATFPVDAAPHPNCNVRPSSTDQDRTFCSKCGISWDKSYGVTGCTEGAGDTSRFTRSVPHERVKCDVHSLNGVTHCRVCETTWDEALGVTGCQSGNGNGLNMTFDLSKPDRDGRVSAARINEAAAVETLTRRRVIWELLEPLAKRMAEAAGPHPPGSRPFGTPNYELCGAELALVNMVLAEYLGQPKAEQVQANLRKLREGGVAHQIHDRRDRIDNMGQSIDGSAR